MQPTQLGPYTITGTLGKGGMGAVYEATDGGSGGPVAVKTLATHLGDDPALRRRLLAEIEVLKALRHPGIVRMLAFGEQEGLPYFAMELVRGRSLEQLLRDGQRFDWRKTVDVALAITRALKSAHDHGVVHRDLKPANLLFPDDPAADGPVKLADFGIARLFGDTSLTVAGTVMGTAEYMAPEQAAGSPVDHRADLYALGLVIYAMLAGRPPFRGGTPSEVLRRQRTETPPRLSAALADVPAGLDDLVDRLLAKDPARRPASALAVGRLLSAIEGPAATSGSAGMLDGSSGGHAAGQGAPGAGVDLLAPTRATVRESFASPSTIASQIDGHGATMPGSPPVAADASASGSLAHQPTAPDRDGDGKSPPAASRFVTLEDLHRAAHEAEQARWWQDAVLRVAAGIGIAAVLIGGGYALLRPPTADELHARIMTLAGDPAVDVRDARPLIDSFLERHGGDPRAAEIRDVRHRIDLNALEVRVRRQRLGGKPLPAVEREYRAAMERQADGAEACLAALEGVLALHPDADATPAEADLEPEERTSLWLDLVRRRITELRERIRRDRAADLVTATATLADATALAEQAAAAEDEQVRADIDRRRRRLLTGFVDLYGAKSHVAEQVDRARALLSEIPVASEDAVQP